MKRILLGLAGLAFVATSSAQLYVAPEEGVECTTFLTKDGRGRAQQGLEFYKDYIFSCEDAGHVNIYSFKQAKDSKGKALMPIAGFELASSDPENHVNNVDFGLETKKGASFPLLYITNGKVGSELEWLCFVESITKKGKKYTSEIAQTIKLDSTNWKKKGYVPIFGAPSWMVDRERGYLWVFGARKRTITKVTKNAYENQYVATKFRIPKLSEGEKVTLGVNDILDQVVFPYEVWFTQAGCMRDGKIYFCYGVGKDDDTRPSCVRIYDTDRRALTARYNVRNQVIFEPEDIVVQDGAIYVNTNTNAKKSKDLPVIFKLSMPKEKPAPTTALEEVLQDPEKAGGVYYVTDLSAPLTPAPKGYEPFYINGYFRHGARHIDDLVTYPAVFGLLEQGARDGNLTPFGQAIYDRLIPFKQNVEYKEADLTQIGYRQTREIGRRLVQNYPQVFASNPYLKANATNVLRVAATMQSVISGIQKEAPETEWVEIDNSRSFLPELNPYGTVCPGRHPNDAQILSKDNSWYRKYRAYLEKNVDADAFFGRLFVDPAKAINGQDKYDLEFRFWLMASLMQCLDRQVPIWDLFTPEEILAWTTAENYKYVGQKGPEPASRGRSWGLGSRTLRHLINESSEDIALGRHGANLNFGHDGTLMAMLTNLQTGTWARPAETPEDALNSWRYWQIPMGTNLQMVFYRSAKNPDILVKLMLNEKDLELPLTPVEKNYYRWDDFRKFYLDHCDTVERSLSETATLPTSAF